MSGAVVRVLCGIAVLACARWAAAWPSDSTQGVPVCAASGAQSHPAAVSDGTGGVVVVWQDSRGGMSIYGTHLLKDGTVAPGWALNGNPLCVVDSSSFREDPQVVALPDGRFVAVWADSRFPGDGTYAQCFDGSGTTYWTTNGVRLSLYLDLSQSMRLIGDGQGGFLLAVTTRFGALPPLDSIVVTVQRVSADGQPLWGPTGIRPGGSRPRYYVQGEPDLVGDGSGGALIVFEVDHGGLIDNPANVYAQRVDANGTPAWPDTGIELTSESAVTESPRVMWDGSGGFYVGWGKDFHPSAMPDTAIAYVGRFAGDGSVFPGWPVNGRPVAPYSYEQLDTQVFLRPDGQLGVVAIKSANGTSGPVYAQRYTAAGDSLWGANGRMLVHSQPAMDVCLDGAGGFIALSLSQLDGSVRAYRVALDGTNVWNSQGVAVNVHAGAKTSGQLVPDSSGGAVAVWVDQRADAGDIYAQNIRADGTLGGDVVATLLALVSADASPGRVTLRWFAAGGGVGAATVYRNVGGAGWQVVGRIAADGAGELTYVDTDVAPGQRYGYRLGVLADGREALLGEAWVTTPAGLELALRGAQPNPTAGALTVTFALPDGAPATLEALDIAGRRVAEREVGTLGAGTHVLRLAEPGAELQPGVYTLCLRHGGRVLTARVVMTR